MSEFAEKLKLFLKQDIVDLKALKALLDKEKKCLKTRNSADIQNISQHKSQTIQQLDSRSKLKARLIAASGLAIKPGQVGSTLSTLNDDELMVLWHESRQKLASCKDQNVVNGTIISHSIQRTNKLMTIIRGQNQSPNLYGQQGKAQAYGQSTIIGEA